MSSNHLFTYTKTDNAFVTLELCKLHKIDMSYLCIFDDVVYISMRIEIICFVSEIRHEMDVIYISMMIEMRAKSCIIKNRKRRCNLYKYKDGNRLSIKNY